jgi:ABC-type polysaccharide/polyol phosphate transport system ATPase subunit
MNKPIISIEKLCKKYTIGGNHYGLMGMPTFRDAFSHKINNFFSNNGKSKNLTTFWALKDISFEINRGEIVGILGKNGAGKSTLLKILSRITYPTSGKIVLRGSLSSLLEVGTGFNPELTGGENIYLNGAIMGMSKAEIDKKFSSIVSFSEIENFIDTPVKRYSSGMYTRLAFSVAAHLEPDLLIIDEVLAVGDNDFQKKCIQKMTDFANEGRTILFVSHDLKAVKSFCTKGIVLHKGTIVFNGDIADALKYYDSKEKNQSDNEAPITGEIQKENNNPVEIGLETPQAAPEDQKQAETLSEKNGIPQKMTGWAKFTDFQLSDSEKNVFMVGEDISLKFSLSALQETEPILFSVSIYNKTDGDWVIGVSSSNQKIYWPKAEKNEIKKGKLILKDICLSPGEYIMAIAAQNPDLKICYALTDLCLSFSVQSEFPTWGKFIHPCNWEVIN